MKIGPIRSLGKSSCSAGNDPLKVSWRFQMQKAEIGGELDRSRIPRIVFEQHPKYVELYDKA